MLFLIDWRSGDAEKRDELHSLGEAKRRGRGGHHSSWIYYVSMCGWVLIVLHSSSNGRPR